VLGFSYDDPPNKVKRVLMGVALAHARGAAEAGAPGAHAQLRRLLDRVPGAVLHRRLPRLQEINDEFMTRVWYAAKRNGLNIPFPIQTSYEYHFDLPPPPIPEAARRGVLAKVPVFVPLRPEELEALAHDVRARGLRPRRAHRAPGRAGDAMYVILEGTGDRHHRRRQRAASAKSRGCRAASSSARWRC
jgi:hypothetical protein